MFQQTIKSRASGMHFAPQEKCPRIRQRMDGAPHVQADADLKIASAVEEVVRVGNESAD